MSDFKFGAVSICELGDVINKKLIEDGVNGEAVLVIPVPHDKFTKVDEDLFYRIRGKGENFVPSDDEIVAKYSDRLKIIIQKEK